MADRSRTRKQLGAWYTPPALVEHLLDEVLGPLLAERAVGTEVWVLDPACGDGRFLLAAAERLVAAGLVPRLVGVDIDRVASAQARQVLRRHLDDDHATIVTADALSRRWGRRRFDLVVGNPPFLTPLSSEQAARHSSRVGGPYADAAAEFLALACDLADPDRGRVGLVLPLSILAARDAGPVRRSVDRCARLDWCWFAPRPVFDAEVRTCALGLMMGDDRSPTPSVRRSHGRRFRAVDPVSQPSDRADDDRASWSWLIADQLGVPALPTGLQLGDPLDKLAVCGADFRDEYYGLIGAVFDQPDHCWEPILPRSAKLVTSGLIDPGHCAWGERPMRFAKLAYLSPVVVTTGLSGAMQTWARQRLVPKVLVASQTRVIEAVADPAGEWLPGVPVVSVTPHDPGQVWRIAAALTGPVPSAWLASRTGGSGLSAHSLRVSAPELARLPMPAGDLTSAVDALQRGDIAGCAAANTEAYGVTGPEAATLLSWWLSAARVPTGTERSGQR